MLRPNEFIEAFEISIQLHHLNTAHNHICDLLTIFGIEPSFEYKSLTYTQFSVEVTLIRFLLSQLFSQNRQQIKYIWYKVFYKEQH